MGYNEGDLWLDNLPAYRAWKAKKEGKDMEQIETIPPVKMVFTVALSIEATTFRKLVPLLKDLDTWTMERVGISVHVTFTDWRFINILNEKRILYTLVDQSTLF